MMTAEQPLDPIRVLIADDQPLLRHSLSILVDGAPDLSAVAQAGTGSDAVHLARETAPDVILMDIRMPGGDGIDATRRITGDRTLSGTKVTGVMDRSPAHAAGLTPGDEIIAIDGFRTTSEADVRRRSNTWRSHGT